jgi:hypothetical protein
MYIYSKEMRNQNLKKQKLTLGTFPVEQTHPHPPLVVPEDVGSGYEQGSVAHKEFSASVRSGPSPQATLLQVRPNRHLRHTASHRGCQKFVSTLS